MDLKSHFFLALVKNRVLIKGNKMVILDQMIRVKDMLTYNHSLRPGRAMKEPVRD